MPRYLRIAAGSILLILGIAGLALPFLQGLLFILLGIWLLARDIPLFERIARQARSRFPRASGAADNACRRIARWWRSS